ncbi:MAG: acylneuraminate cytidylyltransferase [Chlorobiaceae bacterium]|nr:acylneuraminate cytidylyltransferase [Chlorobiaceae bacterium]
MRGRIVAIVQARMQSNRLPGKVLKELLGRPMIDYVVERLRRSRLLDDLVIATSLLHADDPVADYCVSKSIRFHRGSECDVLNRYFETALICEADIIVRVCADSPLIDPDLVDELIEEFLNGPTCDYLSNTINQSCPLGMNTEVFTFEALKQAELYAETRYEREHVTPYIYRHRCSFTVHEKHYQPDLSNYRLTVDTQEDFELVQQICERLSTGTAAFGLSEIIGLLDANPDLMDINANVMQTRPEK